MLSLNIHPYLMPPDTNTLVTSDILETPQILASQTQKQGNLVACVALGQPLREAT